MIDLEHQIKCVDRELKQRARVYPRLVAKGSMTQQQAEYEVEAMKAVRATLEDAAKRERLL